MTKTKSTFKYKRHISLSRRNFLKTSLLASTGLAIGGTLSSSLSHNTRYHRGRLMGKNRRVVIVEDRAHYDLSQDLTAYTPPTLTTSNQLYLNKVGHNTFLARHWFT